MSRSTGPSPGRRVCATACGALGAVALVLAGCGSDRRPTAEDAPDPVPPEVTEHAGDWPLPGRDYANSRAVVDSPIDSSSVEELVAAWSAPLEGFGVMGNAATTPLILGDRILVQDLGSTVRMFERDTGALVWETAVDDGINIGPNGVAVGWGLVFATKGAKAVMALDIDTGAELWSTEIVSSSTEGIDIQPVAVDGLVLVSTVPVSLEGQFTGGDRGILHALDADTGEVVWSFDTTASESGGSDLWGNPEVNSGGGAWYPPAVDVDEGIVYWGTGNPAPFPGTPEFPNGSSRPGANLHTNSVLAMDLATGDLIWSEQVIEHDLFDRDHVHTMLVETDDGTAVVSTGKAGIVVGHDPGSGEVLWQTPVGVHRNDDLNELDGPTEVWPGTFGGVITPPAHADGVVYVATLNAPTRMEPDRPMHIGSELGTAPGEVAAVDAGTGELLWSTEVDGDPLGGATVVADLVLTATHQGQIFALDRGTGEVIHTVDAPGGINGWPAVDDDLIVWPVGFATPATLFALTLPD